MVENTHKYEVLIKSGKGSYGKDILSMEFSVNGQNLKFRDILDRVFALEEENEKLKNALRKSVDSEAKIDALLSQSLDLLQKKVARIEQQLNKEEK